MGLINVLAELERIGWEYQASSEDHVKCRCPFHEDETPSCSVNIREGLFSCKAAKCAAAGDILAFLCRVRNQPRAVVYEDLARRYDLEKVKIIEPSVVENYHQEIWRQPHMLKELYLRGVVDADIRFHRLGFAKGRITIPIRNASNNYVNIKYYLPGGPSDRKMLQTKYRGQIRLFPIDQMKFDKVVICGGEIKAIVARRILNPIGIGAVSPTGGEGNWDHKLTPEFKDKQVWVMMDIDEGGVKAASKICAIMRQVARWVGLVQLPLDIDKYPHGDVNDFVATEKGDLAAVVQATAEWVPPSLIDRQSDDEEPLPLRFSDAVKSDHVGRRVKFPGTVSAINTSPYAIPRLITPICDKSDKACSICAVYPTDKKAFLVSPESPAILAMVEASEDKIDRAVKNALSIPQSCRQVTFQVTEHYTVEDVRVNPSMDITNRDNDRTQQKAVCVSCEPELNVDFEFIGRMYPHPKTQQATLLISGTKATADSLSRYQPTRLADLRMFRPAEWTAESIAKRLDDLYADLEANVTRIYMRRDIHLFVDLTYHSPLMLTVDGKTTKGWVETLIVGDSAQGKSEVSSTLQNHYGLGEKVVCKNASVPGLLGGLKQMGNAWFVAWGVLPCNDRKLVIMEELKGCPTNVIAALTDARSSGIAELSKIEKKRTHSRTRILAISNARQDRKMSSFNYGVDAIKDLIGAPEDVRRFDAALIVADEDIDPTELNMLVRNPPKVKHQHDADLCRELILWAWTRHLNQVIIDDEASQLISEEASKLADEYSPVIPLIDGGSTRHKISRLAAALAARTFSTGESELELRVRVCHVQFIVDMLRRVYNKKSFGYNYYSDSAKVTDKMLDPRAIKVAIDQLAFPEEMREHLLYTDEFDMVDLQDWCGIERDEAQRLLSLLVRKRAIRRRDRKYHKTAEFILWLKNVELKGAPDHVKKDIHHES